MLTDYDRGYRDGASEAAGEAANGISKAMAELAECGALEGGPIPREQVTDMLQHLARTMREGAAKIKAIK